MNQRSVRPLSASGGAGTAGTRPDTCQCDAPRLDPADDEAFCWQCLRFVDEDRSYDAWRPERARQVAAEGRRP